MIIDILDKIKNLDAIEIGGPTPLFKNYNFKLYDKLNSLDGFNMKDNIWQKTDKYYWYDNNRKGNQYFGDCSLLDDIKNINKKTFYKFILNILSKLKISKSTYKKYDLLISSHQIEHLANPIKSIINMKYILKDASYILAILPNKNEFWDRDRDYTSFEHLLEDYNNDVYEFDLTHLNENLETSHYKTAGQELIDMAHQNHKYRIMHHHCFDIETMNKMFEFSGFKTIYSFIDPNESINMIYFGEKIKMIK